MANLLNENIGLNYQGILNLETINTPLSGALQYVTDGTGQTSPLRLSTTSVKITGGNLFVDSNLFNTGFIETGRLISTTTATASTPPVSITGGWFSGGTATTTKPQLLIEPTGTTSTAWSTSGTGLGINAASTFNGRLIEAQKDGVSKFYVSVGGDAVLPGYVFANVLAAGGGNVVIKATSGGIMAIYDGTENNFDRLQFGGTTSLYPALKRSTTNLEVKLADDSAYTGLNSGLLTTNVATATGGTSSNGIALTSTNAATSGTTYYNSPYLAFNVNVWNGSASVAESFKTFLKSYGSGSNELQFLNQTNTVFLTISSSLMTMYGSIATTSGGNITSAGTFILGSNAIISAPSSAVVRLRNASAGPLSRLELGDSTQGARLILSTGNGIPGFTDTNGNNIQRFTFGPSGITAPALAPVTTSTAGDTLKAVFADGTGDAFIMGKHKTHAAYVATTVTPTGYLVVFDSTGTSYRIPAVAGA